MTSKPGIIIRQIEELYALYSKPILQFKDWLVDEEYRLFSNAGNYLRVLKLFSQG